MTSPLFEPGSSASLMTRMPPFLLDAWQVGKSERLAPGEKLRVRLHLSWVGIRALVGVVCSAWEAARPKDEPDEVGVLAFEKETWGTWLAHGEKAARATARVQPDGPGARFVRLLLPGTEESVLADAKRIVEIRNRVYHGRFGGEVSPDEAEQALEELRGPLLKLITGLRLFGNHPIVWFEDPTLVRGKVAVRLVAAFGQQPDSETVPFCDGLEGGVPFLLLSDGSLLRLDPWIAVGTAPGRAMSTCGLVARRGKAGLEYEAGAESLVFKEAAVPPGAPRVISRAVTDAQMAALLGVPNRPPPSKVGSFQVLERLGHGATSVVYLARDTRPGASVPEVALKVLRPELAVEREVRERFRREAVAMARIQHPGVVGVLDHGEDAAEGPWIAMEVVRNGSLADEAGVLSVRPYLAVRYAVQVLEALECVHSHGIVHRDIKPSNILLDGEQARLVDFGIARLGDAAGLTRSLHASGTLSFAAPEQLDGRAVDHRADIFGVGRVLRTLVVGRGRLPKLHAVIRRASHADPEHRYPTARAMREALLTPGLLSGEGAPISPGDRLGDYQVTGEPEAVAPGVWVAEGEAPNRDGPRGLVLAFEPDAKAALDARVRALNLEAKFKIGFDGIQREEDALVAVLGRRPWDAYAAALFGAPVPPLAAIPAYVAAAVEAAPASSRGDMRRPSPTSPDATWLEPAADEPAPGPRSEVPTTPAMQAEPPAVSERSSAGQTLVAPADSDTEALVEPPQAAPTEEVIDRTPSPIVDALPALGGLSGAALGTLIVPCIGTVALGWLGWWVGSVMQRSAHAGGAPPSASDA